MATIVAVAVAVITMCASIIMLIIFRTALRLHQMLISTALLLALALFF